MVLKNQRNILRTWTKIIYTAMLCQNLSDGLNPVKFNLDKYDDNSLRCCISEVDLKYPMNYKNCTTIIP